MRGPSTRRRKVRCLFLQFFPPQRYTQLIAPQNEKSGIYLTILSLPELARWGRGICFLLASPITVGRSDGAQFLMKLRSMSS
jgi:hypothetical protein